MPKLEAARFINLGVSLAKFDDLLIEFSSKNTYVLAGNATGKSTIIGFILNTLSPYAYNFPRGDSSKDRKIEHYVDPINPGVIALLWRLDTSEKMEDRYLLLFRTLSLKRGGLRERFFHKTYTDKPEVNLQSLSIIDDDEKYLTFNELNKYLRSHDFEQVDVKRDWIEILEDKSIDSGIVKRLLKMNESENATKELISFKNEQEFIEYLIDDIRPVPEHAEQFMINLKDQYTHLQLLPKTEAMIEYLQDVKQLMEENKDIYTTHQTLSKKINSRLLKLNGIDNTLLKVSTELDSLLTKNREDIDRNEQELEELSDTIARVKQDFKLKKYQYQTVVIERLEVEQNELNTEKNELALRLQFLTVFPEIKDYHKIKKQIDKLDTEIDGKLGPIQERIRETKSTYQTALSHQYGHRSFQKEELETKLSEHEDKKTSLGNSMGRIEQEISSLRGERKDKQERVKQINEDENKLLAKLPEADSFDKLAEIVNSKLLGLNEQRTDTRKDRDEIRERITTTTETKRELLSEIDRKKTELQELNTKYERIIDVWQEITKTDYFGITYGTTTGTTPQFHVISEDQIDQISTEIEEKTQDKMTIQLELDGKQDKVQYYEENNNFPPVADVSHAISVLKEANISAFSGWDWFATNQNFIDDQWFKVHPYVFEGVVVQGTTAQEARNILIEEGIVGSQLLIIISSMTLQNPPPTDFDEFDVRFVPESVQWKYDDDSKTEFYETLSRSIASLKRKIIELDKQITSREEFKELALRFRRLTTEDEFSEIQVNQREIRRDLDKLDQQVSDIEKKLVELENTKTDLEKSLNTIMEKIQRFEELNKQKIRLETRIEDRKELQHDIESIHQKLNKLTLESDQLASEKEKLDDIMTRLRSQKDQLLIDLSDLTKEFRQIFSDDPPSTTFETPATNLDNARSEFKRLQAKLDENDEIQTLRRQRSELQDQYQGIGSKRDNFIQKNNLDTDRLNKLVELYQYKDTQEEFGTLSKRNDKITTQLTQIDARINQIKPELIQLQSEFGELDTEMEISEEILKEQTTELENKLTELEEKQEVLAAEIEKLVAKQENLQGHIDQTEAGREDVGDNKRTYSSLLRRLDEEYTPDTAQTRAETIENIETTLDRTLEKLRVVNRDFASINDHVDQFDKVQNKFKQQLSDIISKADQNEQLSDFEVVDYLRDFEIAYIPKIINEAENEISERKVELQKYDNKVQQVINFLKADLSETIHNINDFQNTRIQSPSSPSFNNIQPVKIDFRFAINEIESIVETYLQQRMKSLDQFDSYPSEWEDYKPMLKYMLNEILDQQIKRVQFAIPQGKRAEMMDFEEAMRFSGGQTATLAIILFCYIAHYKIKFNRQMRHKNPEYVSSIPISTIFINDNPMGAANREDFVRMQLDIAKSLNVQLIYFSGITESHNIEEFDNKINLVKNKGNKVQVVEKGVNFQFKPLREINYEEEIAETTSSIQ